MIKNKKAAIELSIGTIVVVVLAMSMLILGLVFIRTIFKGTTNVADMTNKELESQIGKLFGDSQKLALFPSSGQKDIKKGKIDGFAFGIKNFLQGTSGLNAKFAYEVIVADPDIQSKCGVSAQTATNWIVSGRSDKDILIPTGEEGLVTPKVLLEIPQNAALCTIRYRITVTANGNTYATDYMAITIK